MKEVNRKIFAKMNGCLHLRFTWRLEGVSSFDEDIEKKNCNKILQNKTKQHVPFQSNVYKGDYYMKARR
jgi:hypothetical protein